MTDAADVTAGEARRPAPVSPPVRAPLRQAVADAVPLIIGYLPFGLILGATIAASDISNLAGLASSPLIFAGASQLATIELLDAGATAGVVIATGLVINLRHVMYSGALAPYFLESPTWFRLAGPHLMADPVYTLSAVRFPSYPTERLRRAYYTSLGLTMFVAWTTMTAAGILVGAAIPPDWNLDLAVPLVFLALLIPMITDRATLVAAIVGGSVTVAAQGIPLHLGLIVGAVSGVVAGLLLDRES